MEVILKNIGIVKDSTISVDGLTVITGKNNSGKTTVGKALYALLDAVSDLQNKARIDRCRFIEKCLDDVVSTLDILRVTRFVYDYSEEGSFKNPLRDYPSIQALILQEYKHEMPMNEIEGFAKRLSLELNHFNITCFGQDKAYGEFVKLYYTKNSEKESFVSILEDRINKAKYILSELFNTLEKDSELVHFARQNISETLRLEFSNQIQPVSISAAESSISIVENSSVYFNLEIAGNKVVNNGSPVFYSSPYKSVYLIDDPFVLDDAASTRRLSRGVGVFEIDSILNPTRILTHREKVKRKIRSKVSTTILEQTMLEEKLKKIKEEIDSILPGTFEFVSDGDFYIHNGKKLKVSNLATGSKMFSIIKILLEKGEINDNTMLILDEPEAHLHPSWQNHFAEIIVLLVKELQVNVLLTTHSSNFVLALDAYMRQYSIEDKTNFYQTEMLDDGMVEYTCVNEDIGSIYQDFLQYLSEVKMLRNECIRKAGGNR